MVFCRILVLMGSLGTFIVEPQKASSPFLRAPGSCCSEPLLQNAQAGSPQSSPRQTNISKVDPMVPWYGPLIRNPYESIITPVYTTCTKQGHIVQSHFKKLGAHTRGPWENCWNGPVCRVLWNAQRTTVVLEG